MFAPWFLLLVLSRAFADIIVATNNEDEEVVRIYKEVSESRYGSKEIPKGGFRGLLTLAQPEEPGCEELFAPPPHIENRFSFWIVLVSRGNCSFGEKIRMAQNSNYNAVIVYSLINDDTVNMSVKNSTGLDIPAFYVGKTIGTELEHFYSIEEDHGEHMLILTSYNDLVEVDSTILLKKSADSSSESSSFTLEKWWPLFIILPIVLVVAGSLLTGRYCFRKYYHLFVVKI